MNYSDIIKFKEFGILYIESLPNKVSSADNFCKQFGVRSGPAENWA